MYETGSPLHIFLQGQQKAPLPCWIFGYVRGQIAPDDGQIGKQNWWV